MPSLIVPEANKRKFVDYLNGLGYYLFFFSHQSARLHGSSWENHDATLALGVVVAEK
jgi:hypothetical protein